ncbi:MAG: hypothetical protein IH881_04915 [Myxococcales bacterium]|nr:hypothetical protein [Myxococcales bacterium]MCH7867015.1 hypothetical protein [Myxococcales bacterium]
MAARRKTTAKRSAGTARKKKRPSKAKKKATWGGRRTGAGRPIGSGSGPSPNSRKNRVAVMFTDTELDKLNSLAKKQKLPVATVAYRLIERSLKRA